MILQLSPSIPVYTNKGSGQAFLVVDYSEEYDLFFTIALDDGGDIWTFNSKEVKFHTNKTLNRIRSKTDIELIKESGGDF